MTPRLLHHFLRFVARINGVAATDATIGAALEAADLTEKRDTRIDTLSHGFKRRVGIAHAIVHKPALILLDEPTSGLDPVQIVQMRHRIRTLSQSHTVMVSSHILSEMQQMCDRIMVLHQGKVVAEGTERELSSHLGGATTVSIEVRAGREDLGSALGGVSGITSHEITRETDGLIEATINMESDGREELAVALVGAGLGVRRIDRASLGLESIFMQLTGGTPGAEVSNA